MHSERWAGQFHIANVLSLLLFLASKGRLEEVEERAERQRGKWGRGRRNWNRNPSQWIKKQDSSFYRVYFPPAIALSVCLPAPQRPRHDWYALRAKLATETQKIMHKRWTQFIVFSRGPRGKPKLWIYASDPWDRCWAGRRGEKVQELVSDRRGPLTDKWRDSPRPEGSRRSCATSTASVSAMEVGIIMTL